MQFVRGLFLLVTCVQLSCQQISGVSSSSLWGKTLKIKSTPCLWQLHPETVLPALEELSVCLLLRCAYETEWTAFVYKGPGSSAIELGLQGNRDHLKLWLFGNETKVENSLNQTEWQSLCITWSGKQQKLELHANGTILSSTFFKSTTRTSLASNGTLTLGRSHFVNGNTVQPEYGKSLIGDISQFRVWSTQWSKEQLKRQECTEGDVISWDQKHWKTDCPPPQDYSLHCEWSRFKVKMKIIAQHKHSSDYNCSLASLESAVKLWLESIFPNNISVGDIIISSSHSCRLLSAALPVQQAQERPTLMHVCNTCFLVEVYVKVEPAADVGMVQSDITARLSSWFSLDFLNMTADPDSILVLSVDSFPLVTDSPPTISTDGSPGVRPTESIPDYDSNTTEEPIEINKTLDRADIFFRVSLSLGITGFIFNPPIFIQTLVDEKLNFSSTMKVLNFRIETAVVSNDLLHTGPLASLSQQKQYDCVFHVQEDFKYNVSAVQSYIQNALVFTFSNETLSVRTINVKTKHIVPPDCPEEKIKTSFYGTYIWPQTFPQDLQTMQCRDPTYMYASRLCMLEIGTDKTKWARPNLTNCNPDVTIPQIENVTVTTGNAAEVVEALQNLVNTQISNSSQVSSEDLDTVVGKLDEVVDVGTDSELGASIVAIVADILVSDTNVTTVSNVVLSLTSKMGDTMDFQGTSESITAPAVALSLCNVETEGFTGLTFGITSVSTSLEPEVFVDQKFDSDQIQNTKASISLPHEVQSFFPLEKNTTRLQFQFFATDELFQDPSLPSSETLNRTLNSYIVSASLNNSNVHSLRDKVVVNLSHQKATQPNDKIQCVFWDFQENGGRGGWNGRGCETQSISEYQTRCLCSHLTHFALLLDVSRTPISEVDSYILTVISYVGCGISAIFLGITLLTYLAFGKLRRDNPSKILINLSAALLGLCMLFLLDSWLSSFSNYGLCIATAATLHYFLLASFTWMGLEALHMYLALVKVFNIYVPSYILKFCAVGWGFPLVIVSLVLAIDKDSYGDSTPEEAAVVLQSSDPFCWVTSDEVFYVTVVGFILLILLANLSVFVVVLIQIKRMRINKPSVNSNTIVNDLRAVASLTVLLGLTWSMGFFSFGPARVAMMYLFCILNTLQGFFVFLFHCLMKDNVRKQWRIHLCCGRFRLSEYSDWSRTVTGGHQGKKKHLINMDSDSSVTTTTRKISDTSG